MIEQVMEHNGALAIVTRPPSQRRDFLLQLFH